MIVQPGPGQYPILLHLTTDPAQEYWFVSVNVCDMMPYPFVFFIREVAPDQEPGNLFII